MERKGISSCGPQPSRTTARRAAFSVTESLCPGERCGSHTDAPRAEPGDARQADAARPAGYVRPPGRREPGRPPGPGHESPLRRPVDPPPELPARGANAAHGGEKGSKGDADARDVAPHDGGGLPAVASRPAAGAHPLHELHRRKTVGWTRGRAPRRGFPRVLRGGAAHLRRPAPLAVRARTRWGSISTGVRGENPPSARAGAFGWHVGLFGEGPLYDSRAVVRQAPLGVGGTVVSLARIPRRVRPGDLEGRPGLVGQQATQAAQEKDEIGVAHLPRRTGRRAVRPPRRAFTFRGHP